MRSALLVVVCLVMFTACTGDALEETPILLPDRRGGANGSRTSDPFLAFAPITALGRVVRDSVAVVPLEIVRVGEHPGDVVVTLTDPPRGITADPLTIAGPTRTGTLVVRIGQDAVQGETALAISAREGALSTTTWLALFVRSRPGALDTTFGQGGALGLGMTPIRILVDSADRIHVVGSCEGDQATCVARFDANGAPDTSWAGGVARLDATRPTAAILGSDGSVTIGYGGAIGRLTAFGLPDPLLSASGLVAIAPGAIGGAALDVKALAPGPGGSTFVAFDTSQRYIGFRKLDDHGRADPAWGTGGYTYFAWASIATISGISYRENTGALAFIGLSADVARGVDAVGVGQLDARGKLDTSFARVGYRSFPLPGALFVPAALPVAFPPDGRLIAGFGSVDQPASGPIVAVSATGEALDGSFGLAGVAPLGSRSLVRQRDGKLVVIDGREVRRLTMSGTVDETFGAFTPPLGMTPGFGAVLEDGRILVLCTDAAGRRFLLGVWD